jgi:hypothetical protein
LQGDLFLTIGLACLLSDKFAAATSEAQNTALAAVISWLRTWHSSSAAIGSILLQTGALVISVVMLRSKSFSKLTAWVGVITFGLELAHALIIPFLPAVGAALMYVAGPLYLLWLPLLARDFFRLRQE